MGVCQQGKIEKEFAINQEEEYMLFIIAPYQSHKLELRN